MFTKQLILWAIGLSAGGVIAAGVFAFLAIIGVFPRLIGKTKTSRRVLLYETVIVAGGILGNLLDLYEFPIPVAGTLNRVFRLSAAAGDAAAEGLLGIYGLAVGVFVGCLAMSLAETLKALPVICRRIRLAVGLPCLIFAIAFGKLIGSLLYFSQGMGSGG